MNSFNIHTNSVLLENDTSRQEIMQQITLAQFIVNKNIRYSKNHQKIMGNTNVSMKHNANMRRHHRIQQPGFDVQRFGHK
jgi:hypothetical protein